MALAAVGAGPALTEDGVRFLRVACRLLIVASLSLGVLGPSPAWAGHAMNQGGDCYDCHDLSMLPGAGEPGTSYLSSSARGIIVDMRAANGGTAPDVLGCLYCHNSSLLKDDPEVEGLSFTENRMRDASTHFRGKASMHPVGYDLTKDSLDPTRDTKGHLLSSFDCKDGAGNYFGLGNTVDDPDDLCAVDGTFYVPGEEDGTGDRAVELDCVDCHDVTQSTGFLGYPQHGKPLASNPFMLRTSAGDTSNLAAGEYDGVCRRCHGSDTRGIAPFKSTTKDLRLGGAKHEDASDETTHALKEDDGTFLTIDLADPLGTPDFDLKSSKKQCTTCHATHYSATNPKLFAAGLQVGNSSKCSTCHLAGDQYGNYEAHGHGKPFKADGTTPLNMACSSCHEVTSAHDAAQAYVKMLNTQPDPNTSGLTGKSLRSICTNLCHSASQYALHGSGGETVGCLDCHDEHSEGAGAGSNSYMIPRNLPNGHVSSSITFFQSTGEQFPEADYWVADNLQRKLDDGLTGVTNTGVCDNGVCHAGVKKDGTGPNIWPLSTYLGGASHSGGSGGASTAVGGNCDGCHQHTDDLGSWRAGGSCDACHESNDPTKNRSEIPRTHLSTSESLATHNRHVSSGLLTGSCGQCHLHDGSPDPLAAPGSNNHNNGIVEFGGSMAGTNLDYSASGFAPNTCTANTCHDAEAGDWKDGLGADACADCHASSGKLLSRAPASGLHVVTVITRHDGGLLGGNCVNCHDAAGPSSAHLNGTLNSPSDAVFAFHANVVSYAGDAGCQAAPACHGGGDGGTWRRRWVGVVDVAPGTAGNDAPGQGVCQNCHGDSTGWRWDEAEATTTDHTDPYAGNAGDRMGEHGICQTCHGWGSATYDKTWRTGDHGNGSVDVNGPDATHGGAAGAEYNDDAGGCMSACHGSQFVLSTASGWAATYGDYGSGDCSSCHKPGGSGPTVVWPSGDAVGRRTSYGSHLGATVAEEGNGFLGGIGGGWNDQCNKCHDFHNGTIKVPAPPVSWTDPSGRLSGTDMQARLGLRYANEAGVSLHLGGTARGGASEAEFCWGCHDANGVSEWGFNTKTTPAGFPVVSFPTLHDGSRESINLGWIYTAADHAVKTSDWALGYWQDEYDALTARRIASIHTANFDPAGQSSSVAANVDGGGVVNRTSPVLEAKGDIRCSNCHDVHDTFGPDGKPYLRGRWMSNPYPPELPPRSGYVYTTGVNVYYPTPRGRSTARDKGGYFIDQNSNWPTANAAMDTLEETGELCTLCHAADVNGMDFYTGKKLWRAPMVNGHSNAALGGTGANKVDLFTGTRYAYGMGMQAAVPGPPYVCGYYGGECDSTYPLSWWMNGCCEGQPVVSNSGWYGTDGANWYGTGTIGGASGPGSQAHKFTCSKCHTPHASGLPALLPQNCIDPSLGNYTIAGHSGANLVANNCHRKTSVSDGWHILAPGQ